MSPLWRPSDWVYFEILKSFTEFWGWKFYIISIFKPIIRPCDTGSPSLRGGLIPVRAGKNRESTCHYLVLHYNHCYSQLTSTKLLVLDFTWPGTAINYKRHLPSCPTLRSDINKVTSHTQISAHSGSQWLQVCSSPPAGKMLPAICPFVFFFLRYFCSGSQQQKNNFQNKRSDLLWSLICLLCYFSVTLATTDIHRTPPRCPVKAEPWLLWTALADCG